jgi:hypothetical protein
VVSDNTNKHDEGNRTYIDELLLLTLVFRPARLVLKDDIVVPAPLHRKVLLIEQRVAQRNIAFPCILFLFDALKFLDELR